jgi:hypothetical protein
MAQSQIAFDGSIDYVSPALALGLDTYINAMPLSGKRVAGPASDSRAQRCIVVGRSTSDV